MTPNQIENYLDLLSPEEIREHAARLIWLASNCITEKIDYIENGGQEYSYALHLDLFYNSMPIPTIDYLMGKLGTNPSAEAGLEQRHLFGRGESPAAFIANHYRSTK